MLIYSVLKTINSDIVKRSLAAAKILSPLEPAGLSRSDGKHPDCATLFLWSNEHCLVWDVTSSDMFAPSYAALIGEMEIGQRT